MSRLASITPIKMIAALKRGGFIVTHQLGSHVYLRHPRTDKRTMVAMHRKDLSRALTKEIITQAGLTVEEFIELR